MKILRTANPPQPLVDNNLPVTVASAVVKEPGVLSVRLQVPTIDIEFTNVADVLAPGDTLNLTVWIQM